LLATITRSENAHGQGTVSLDSLLSVRVSAASKYEQTAAEAPASVTLVTADELERLGYTRLDQVLETIRGFYTSDDRNYSYLGTRGFSRPTDYNNRILLLIDGHTLNDQTWAAAPVGTDIPLNVEAIDRIEIVRGPGSALYGSSAMFAVINVVMKNGASLDGGLVSARAGTAGEREVGVALGRSTSKGLSGSMSALVRRVAGTDLYFPEYDTPSTNNGVAHNLDWDHATSALGTVSYEGLSLRAGIISREKGVPTGSFGTNFNDPRNTRYDERSWGELSLDNRFGGHVESRARLYGDWYTYHGTYPSVPGNPYHDGGGSMTFGGEALAITEFTSRDRLTVGIEYRDVQSAKYFEILEDGTVFADDAPFTVQSAYAENEVQLSHMVALTTGVRIDRNSRHGSVAAPRVALVITPDASTTLKLLYGDAFRAPSAAEADITTSFYERNPTLRPERIRTFELVAMRRVSSVVVLSGSAYYYQLHDLIDQVSLIDGTLQYANIQSADGRGVELEVDARPSDALFLRASYALLVATEEPADSRLTNSPEQIAVATGTFALPEKTHFTTTLRYESGRRTISGTSTPAFVRTDVDLTRRIHEATALSAGLLVTNLFNVYYANPGGLEHLESSLQRDGRRLSFHVTLPF
jgi:iron complex outermembrane receptor protein